MVKFLLVLAAIHIAGVGSVPESLIPSLHGLGHGSIILDWFGFHGTISMGKFITGDPSDEGLLFKLKIPTGGKALAIVDAGLALSGVYVHTMFGLETALGPGVAGGLGGMVGLGGIKWGIFSMCSNGFSKTQFYEMGNYAPVLMKLSDGFLRTLDAKDQLE